MPSCGGAVLDGGSIPPKGHRHVGEKSRLIGGLQALSRPIGVYTSGVARHVRVSVVDVGVAEEVAVLKVEERS